jgi:hypothetical protein
MVVNRLQNGLIKSSIDLWASRVNSQNIFFLWDYIPFISNSDRDFNSESNSASQV